MKNIFAWVEEKWQIIVIGLAALVMLLIFGLVYSYLQLQHRETAPATEIELLEELRGETPAEVSTNLTETSVDETREEPSALSAPKEIIVDVKGEVDHPGVYQMTEGSRIIDVIEKAGGLLKDAETNAVNFAQIVTDQMIIYIPRQGEEIPDVQSLPEDLKDPETVKININRADKDSLMTLNGIGSSKAENILTYREENGLFKTIEDLKNVSGIGEATFNQLKDSITIEP